MMADTAPYLLHYIIVKSDVDKDNVYLIKHPHQQEPFKGAVQIICNIIIPQIMSVKTL